MYQYSTTFHKIQRTNVKFLSVKIITITYIHRQYGYNKSVNTERIKTVDFFLE